MKWDPSLVRLTRQLRKRLVLAALVSGVVVSLTFMLLAPQWPTWAIACVAGLISSVLGGWTEHWWRRLQGAPLTAHLNRRWPQLQDSAQLLLSPPDNQVVLANRQRQKVAQTLQQICAAPPSIGLPTGALRSLVLLTLALACVAALPRALQGLEFAPSLASTQLLEHQLTIKPPGYTGLPERRSPKLDIEVPQSSSVTWKMKFSGPVGDVWLALDDETQLPATALGSNVFEVRQQLETDLVYHVGWSSSRASDSDQPAQRTPPALIQVVADQPPRLEVIAPQFSPQETGDPHAEDLRFVVEVGDDYGIGDAVILATVAKGDGEGVKFRDVELPFAQSQSHGDKLVLSRRWNLPELGLEPGDELYFRARVSDNRSPEPQRSQSAVLMLRWLAPKTRRARALDGIAVDILPEYFRSQRQIIIDTEKLLAETDQLSAVDGVKRARSLALDQKSLRIRYGQYLGEEYESDIGLPAMDSSELDESHADESFSEHLAHAGESAGHDHENHGGHSHDTSGAPGQTTIGGLPGFMADFVHAHDSAEQATLFDTKTRDTLKGALAQMWQSELYLQLTQPAVALPYQYEALTLLKQVQQANRIYVRRAGFEPPALDPGKRLSGDPEDSADSGSRWDSVKDDSDDLSVLSRLQWDLQRGQPTSEDLNTLIAMLAEPNTAAAARLTVAKWKTGSCTQCLAELQSMVWRQLQQRHPPSPANVGRIDGWGGLAEVYLAPLVEQP
ncbi:MAG: hypothetical protein AB8B96_03690 [Lysobacterales bacterium]